MSKKKVLLTGATGMIGGIILKNCLKSEQIEQVVSLSRKPTGIDHPKLVEVIHSDFLNFSGLNKHFQHVDTVYFCLGVYTGQVKDDLFKIITVDYTNAFADALKIHSPKARFCFLSGNGADPKEKSRVSFARYKGMAENYLIKHFESLHIFRPGYIYPVEKRNEPNFSYRLMRHLYPLMNMIYPKGMITSEVLAQAMFNIGMNGSKEKILENWDIKK